jgi:tRNA G18 (ribose-2'-O)-methylase SpoU
MVIILDNIRSLYNVGSIFRTADAAGVEKIYLCGITPEPVDHFGRFRLQFTKVSLGAEKSVQWEYCKSASRLIEKLKKEGYAIFAIEQSKKSIPYYKVVLRPAQDKITLVLGNEIKGLTKAILKKADKILEIPMRGVMVRQAHHPRHSRRGKESLNVAVAFGIIVYHLVYEHRNC